MSNNHLIGKQIIALEIPSSKKTYAVQQRMSELVWNTLVPEMNSLFDRMVGEDEVVQLDRIEIDIGTIVLDEENILDIVDKIMLLLAEKCIQAVYTTRDVEEGILKAPQDQKQLSTREQYFNLWLYWLERGTLPSYTIVPKENWIEKVLETLGLEDKAILQLQAVLEKHPTAFQRLIIQHNATDLKSIVELYTGFSQNGLLVFFNELSQLYREEDMFITRKLTIRELEVVLWKTIYKKVILKREKLSTEKLIDQLVEHPEILALRKKFSDTPEKFKNGTPLLLKAFDKKTNEFLKNKYKKEKKEIKKKNESNAQEKEFLEEVVDKEIERDKSDNRADKTKEKRAIHPEFDETQNVDYTKEMLDDVKVEEPIKEASEMALPQFFKNAGIVLLHPFLNNLFKKMDLLQESRFKNYQCQSKAVLLLHFLVSGNDQVIDFDLVLPKFLCDMPVNIPLDHTMVLSETEKEEADHLLQAVIEHWGVLGSTSPNGLREGFLVREGKLKKEQSGWQLCVEQKAIDVLLDKLPWNLSMIKLPWMKELLKVEWR
ncbi:contractile injection system tape measure protein [Aquimarina sediminis]|uniref:contractile injection system tape measure protein n=1 Tax=Aquimarina sediminis TaxID=2070536 RepID=UPI000CA0465D|nr:contractile injection system tape measure protein [Aquimarina sediminis]